MNVLGVEEDEIVAAAFSLYEGDYGEGEVMRFLEVMRKSLEDINVRALLRAAEFLNSEFDVEGDPAHLVADEIVGMAIAEYIGGTNALFNFFRYDTAKPGVLSSLPPFLDDALGGLIAGCMTRAFS